MYTIAATLIMLWCAIIAWWDVRTRTIPPWFTWPVILGSGVWMAWKGFPAPLVLFIWFFVWDTTWEDIGALIGKQSWAGKGGWLVSDTVGWAGTVAGIMWASTQGEPALAVAWYWAILHGLWRLTGRAGGDISFAMALFGLFPTFRLWYVPLIVSLALLVKQVLLSYKVVLRMGYTLALGGPLGVSEIWRSLWGAPEARPQGPTLAVMGVLMVFLGRHYGIWML